jgi:hypothetical protein
MSISANFNNTRPALLLDFANSQQLDPRVSFSRSTTAPYYDGKTSVLAEQNLLQYSNTLTNAYWGSTSLTITANSIVAPDGTTTANLLTAGAGSAFHAVYTSAISNLASTNYTYSCYLQAGNTYNYATLSSNAQVSGPSNWVAATFNLTSTGSVTQTSSLGNYTYVSSSITQVGSTSWYRCSITFSTTATSIGVDISLNNSATPTYGGYGLQVWNALGTETLYAWGNQLEQRSSVTAYNATTTSAITNYIPQLLTAPINAPRFDFNPTTGESLGLLIEQSSTNLLTYSQLFSDATWLKFRTSVTSTAGVAPDGTQTAQLLVEDATNNTHGCANYGSQTVTSGQQYTFSAEVKAWTRNYVTLFADVGSALLGNNGVQFSLIDGTVQKNTSALTTTSTNLGNGWWRFSYTATATASGNAKPGIYIGSIPATGAANGIDTYTGNGYSGIYIWGAQLEALAFPTSYIATTSAQVTRAVDVASMTGTNFSSWYNNAQGTMFVNSLINRSVNNPSGNYYLSITDGTITNAMILAQVSGVIGQIKVNNTNTFNQTIGTNASLNNATALMALSYGNSSSYLALNGSIGSQVNAAIPSVNSMQIGNRADSSVATQLNGWIRKIAYYPQTVTSAQLQALTGT